MIDLESLKHAAKFGVIALAAAAIQLHLSTHKFTFGRYLINVIMALLAAYLVSSFCEYLGVAESARPGFIGVGAYMAPHLFEGLNNLGKKFSKDPLNVINKFRGK
ncbi:phage holin family protein [Pseudoalteromonas luteoviolacea]|uniref:phage holin family protein n=1 Tax=Pseudoalteromonas luteoviolacea TaxID=43657 RepID=UPI001154BA25|nr:phage holin family protein [Pseudoalteromonas luteoviolacea]TQF70483.1 hypothetical protein FLM44_05145 [Pseudoalteromonas luteoviolacea]